MSTSLHGPAVRTAEAFRDHLETPGRATAVRLAHTLDDLGEGRRADLLRTFATEGPRHVAAEWWQPGATCHLSLELPESFSAGDLWFDPLEVSCGLVVPVAGQEATSAHQPQRFDGWVSLEPVSPWQLSGAHLMDATLPSDLDIVTGEHAFRYCDLFSKLVADTFIWLPLRDTYGGDALARVWGEPHLEYGRGAATSGLVEVYSLDDLTRWRAGENFVPAETSELSPNGYRFRSSAAVEFGLWTGDGALTRTWLD